MGVPFRSELSSAIVRAGHDELSTTTDNPGLSVRLLQIAETAGVQEEIDYQRAMHRGGAWTDVQLLQRAHRLGLQIPGIPNPAASPPPLSPRQVEKAKRAEKVKKDEADKQTEDFFRKIEGEGEGEGEDDDKPKKTKTKK